jgi:hypothetical protein
MKTKKERQLADGIGGRMGWGRSQIKRQRESLGLYKSFNTLGEKTLREREAERSVRICVRNFEKLGGGGRRSCMVGKLFVHFLKT